MSERAAQLFERLSQETWQRLNSAARLRQSFGETTITDLNLLEIASANLPNVWVYKAQGHDEDDFGFDWLWYIGSNVNGWWPFCVQAKKIDVPNARYQQLRHWVASKADHQINLLERYARMTHAIPLYAFYNFVDLAAARAHWHCPRPFDGPQMGCTIVPLAYAKAAHSSGNAKSFSKLHQGSLARPWRCLLRCGNAGGGNSGRAGDGGGSATPSRRHALDPEGFCNQPLDSLPSVVLQLMNGSNPEGTIYALTDDLTAYPKRIMVIDVDGE